jgi:hypothetical protein
VHYPYLTHIFLYLVTRIIYSEGYKFIFMVYYAMLSVAQKMNRMVNERWTGKDMERAVVSYSVGICMMRLRQTTKNIIRYKWLPGRDLNPRLSEYEEYMPITENRYSIACLVWWYQEAIKWDKRGILTKFSRVS